MIDVFKMRTTDTNNVSAGSADLNSSGIWTRAACEEPLLLKLNSRGQVPIGGWASDGLLRRLLDVVTLKQMACYITREIPGERTNTEVSNLTSLSGR
jgi:hypothetical protein